MITVKTDSEIELMRQSGVIVGDALREVEKYVRPGVSTMELNSIVEDVIRSAGAIPSFLNYNGFPAASCISVDDVGVHGFPSLRVLKEGEIVSIDVGAVKNGFHGDAARTFAVGKISESKQRLIDVTKQSFFEGVKFVKEGGRLGDVSHAIQSYVNKFGFGIVREMVGHGIGKHLHEDPQVPNYGVAGTGFTLKKGYALAIEPMITLGDYHIRIDSDGWTCRTIDGSPAAHYENTVVITSKGVEILTL